MTSSYNQEQHDGAYGWDDEFDPNEGGNEFIVLREGNYPFMVKSFERGRHEGSANLPPCNKAILHLTLDGGEQGSAYAKTQLFLHKKCHRFLAAFFRSIGFTEDESGKMRMNWNAVPGATGMCRIKPRTWVSNKDGREFTDNDVDRFLPPDQAPQGNTATNPPAQSAPPQQPPTYAAPPAQAQPAQQSAGVAPKDDQMPF